MFIKAQMQTVDDLLQLRPHIHKCDATIGYWSSPQLPPPARRAANENKHSDTIVWVCSHAFTNISFNHNLNIFSPILNLDEKISAEQEWTVGRGACWCVESCLHGLEVETTGVVLGCGALHKHTDMREHARPPSSVSWQLPLVKEHLVISFF